MVGLSRLHFTDSKSLTPEMERELRAFKMLMHPNMMGSSFKVLCLEKADSVNTENSGPPLSGLVFGSNPRTALGMDKVPRF
jgi:SAM-dependent MidA family methyltransferase